MYKKIMVPLDGSELAECVLPNVEAFIKGFNTSDVIFVRVVRPERRESGEDFIGIELSRKMELEAISVAEHYLNKIIEQLKNGGAALHSEVIVGRVTETLVDYSMKNDIDLIIIATHGYSGITRWVRGSVADRILRSADVPILMVRAPGTKGGI